MPGTKSIADIRKDYRMQSLSEDEVAPNAMDQFEKWWDDAVKSEISEPNAMTLATASADGVPAARVVLLKGMDPRGFIFYTNYNSFKGEQLAENPRACLVFFWKELERQVRVMGVVEKVSGSESDEYFNSRPEGSRISAMVSPQSSVVQSREWLEMLVAGVAGELTGKHIPRPDFWGGYRVKPAIIEFWQGRSNRLHDRLQYSLMENGEWKIERLAP